jgi:hypothetical protein
MLAIHLENGAITVRNLPLPTAFARAAERGTLKVLLTPAP